MFKLKTNNIYRLRKIAGDSFIVGPGSAYEVNDVGAEIWKGIYKNQGIDEIVKNISSDFDEPEYSIKSDVYEFVEYLKENGLVK